MPEMMNFHVEEDFSFTLGAEKKELVVPRMLFVTGKRVLQIIADTLGRDTRSALELVGRSSAANTTLKSKAFDVFAVAAEKVVNRLIMDKNYETILGLLAAASEDRITAKVVEEAKMQYSEVVQVLQYLIDQNFSSLKNLSASLQATTSSGQNG